MAIADAWVMIPVAENEGKECSLDICPLVLCKSCKHLEVRPADAHGHIPYWCTNLNIYTEGKMWFCADAEQRDS